MYFQVDQLFGRDHLFKRSIILIKAWCYYESRILGANMGLFSTYALSILVLYIINLFHSSLSGPLSVITLISLELQHRLQLIYAKDEIKVIFFNRFSTSSWITMVHSIGATTVSVSVVLCQYLVFQNLWVRMMLKTANTSYLMFWV